MMDDYGLDYIGLVESDGALPPRFLLTCQRCGEHLCDAEHDDDLAMLVSMAAAHHHRHVYCDTHVFVDNPDVDDIDDEIGAGLGLEYVYLTQPWSGGEVPVVTYRQFRTFVANHRNNDHNGTWGPVTVTNDKATLIHHRDDSEDPDEWDVFHRVATGPAGEPLYAITGWTFYIYPQFDQPRTFTTNNQESK